MRLTHKQADELLKGRCSQSKKIANNTYLKRDGENIVIRLHETNIITFQPDEKIVVSSGGWRTVTTKDRLNKYLPAGLGIAQERGIWYWHRTGDGLRIPFTDGDSIDSKGNVIFQATPQALKAQQVLRKRIAKYAKDMAAALPLAAPSGGDCQYCYFKDDKGNTMGDKAKDTTHLIAHIKDKYYVPSLAFNALKEAGNSDFIIAIAFRHAAPGAGTYLELARERTERAVKKYLYRRLGTAA